MDTVESIAEAVAHKLGDDRAESFTLDRVKPYVQEAYRALHAVVVEMGLPLAEKTVYWLIDAYTGVFVPSQVGITNIGRIEVDGLREYGDLTTVAVSSVADDSYGRLVTTSTAHSFATGDVVALANVLPASLCVKAPIVVVSSTSYRYNGLLGGEEYASGGYAVKSGIAEMIVTPRDTIDLAYNVDRLYEYTWDGNAFLFHPAPEQRLLSLNYASNGEAPSAGAIDINGATNFLVSYAASLCARRHGMKDDAADLLFEACGQSKRPDATGGYLHDWVVPLVQQKNLQIRRAKPFRGRRTGTHWI